MTLPSFKEYLIQEATKRPYVPDPKQPATRDVVKQIMNEPIESDEGKPSTKRRGQRATRALRRRYGKQHPEGLKSGD